MDIEPPQSTDFNVIKEDFKKHQTYGILAGAMHLAKNCRPAKPRNNNMAQQKSGGRRVFTSKILGGVVGVMPAPPPPLAAGGGRGWRSC